MQIRATPSQDRIQELRTRCEDLRSECRSLEAKERQYAAEARQNAEAAAQREELVVSLKARHARFRGLTWLAGGASVVATGAALALASPLVGVVAAGAVVGWMFAAREKMRMDDGVHVVGFSAGNQALLSSLNQAQVESMKQQQATLGAKIAEFEAERQRLEVESLVASPSADFSRVIQAGDEMVTIGGVSLPRRRD